MTPNPLFEPTRTGKAQLAFISFWANGALPARAAQQHVGPNAKKYALAQFSRFLVTESPRSESFVRMGVCLRHVLHEQHFSAAAFAWLKGAQSLLLRPFE